VSAENDSPVPSKTVRKREAEYLQNMGRRLSELSAEQLDGLDLPKNLLDALTDYQRFPSRGAKRRQLQFIGKIMRDIDADYIESRLADFEGDSAQARYLFNQLEQWRDELVSDPDALTRFIEAYPIVDRQHLRQLINKVTSAKNDGQRKPHARQLFRFLRETVNNNVED
jgi:ribosome-associated protein